MCSICHDAGYLRTDLPVGHPKFGRYDLCACQMVKVASRIQIRIGTPLDTTLRLESVSERGSGSRGMIDAARLFLASPKGFFTIYGQVDVSLPTSSANGNGKTTCIQAVTNECVALGVAALYITASDLVDFIKAGIGDDDYDVEDRLSVLCGINVLCLDEVSQSVWSDWMEDKLTTLIDRRYRMYSLGTVLAMDDNPYQFFHRRIMSRLGTGFIVQNSDPDMRPAFKGLT